MTLPARYSVELPDWVAVECSGAPVGTDREKMALACRLARRNVAAGTGGPFAALVLDTATGTLVSAGVNLVLASGLSVCHAEVVALSLAQAGLGRWDLGAGGATLELVVNWRPCVQCFGAVLWSGVRRLVIAGAGPELEALTGFDEGPLVDDWRTQLEARGIAVTDGVGRDEALAVFREYRARVAAGTVTVYNARGPRASTA